MPGRAGAVTGAGLHGNGSRLGDCLRKKTQILEASCCRVCPCVRSRVVFHAAADLMLAVVVVLFCFSCWLKMIMTMGLVRMSVDGSNGQP